MACRPKCVCDACWENYLTVEVPEYVRERARQVIDQAFETLGVSDEVRAEPVPQRPPAPARAPRRKARKKAARAHGKRRLDAKPARRRRAVPVIPPITGDVDEPVAESPAVEDVAVAAEVPDVADEPNVPPDPPNDAAVAATRTEEDRPRAPRTKKAPAKVRRSRIDILKKLAAKRNLGVQRAEGPTVADAQDEDWDTNLPSEDDAISINSSQL